MPKYTYQFVLLDYNQLIKLVKSEPIECEIGVIYPEKIVINPDLRQLIIDYYIPKLADSSHNPLFYSFYLVFFENKNFWIGDIGLKGEPNEEGELEVGYSIYPQFRNKKHMSRILSLFCKMHKACFPKHPIIAYIDKDNWVSQKVLENNQFQKVDEDDEYFKFKKIDK